MKKTWKVRATKKPLSLNGRSNTIRLLEYMQQNNWE